jgi:hypothetical protein
MDVKLALTLREEHRLRVFENEVMRRIFAPKRQKVTEGKKVKVSRYMPWRRTGGEEVYLLLILNLGTRWG